MNGALPYEQELITEKEGSIPIGKIVNQETDVDVLSYSFDKRIFSYVPIQDYIRYPSIPNWLRIEHNGNSKSSRIVCSGLQEFFVGDKGWVKAKSVSTGDLILNKFPKPSKSHQELLIGSMLGDGSLTNGSPSKSMTDKNLLFRETHSIKQKEYLRWKCKILGHLAEKPYYEESRYDEEHPKTKKICFYTKAIPYLDKYQDFIPNTEFGRKVPDWLELNPKIMSIWYCDDGNLMNPETQRGRIRFNTQCFSNSDCNILIEKLSNFGIEAKRNDYGGGNILDVPANSTERFFELTTGYIPECMEYKVLPKYQTPNCEWQKSGIYLDSFETTNITEGSPEHSTGFSVQLRDDFKPISSQLVINI